MNEDEKIKLQLEFVKWLKSKGLYCYSESSFVMQKMYNVWLAMKSDQDG